MSVILDTLLLLVLTMSVVLVAAVAFFLTAAFVLRRASRVSNRQKSWAPVRWTFSPSRPALLHRRLHRSVASVRLAVPAPRRREVPTRLQDLADELEDLAADADRSLVLATGARGRDRVALLAPLAGRVESIESMGRRLVTVAAEMDPERLTPSQWSERAGRVEDDLWAHEAAIEDLRRFDTEWDGTVPQQSPSGGR